MTADKDKEGMIHPDDVDWFPAEDCGTHGFGEIPMTIRLATNHRRITVEPMEPDFTFTAFAKVVMAYLVATTCAVSIGTFLAVLWIATP